MLQKLVWIAAAGAAGTLCRYGLGGLVQRACGVSFPCGTLVVNVLGCFLFGFIWVLAEDRLIISGEMRLIALVGFMGSFTTFSTFVFETGEMLRDSQWMSVLWNVLAQNIVGVLAFFAGLGLGKSV